MNKEEFMINQMGQRIAQLEADKAGLQADYQLLAQEYEKAKNIEEKEDDENAKNE